MVLLLLKIESIKNAEVYRVIFQRHACSPQGGVAELVQRECSGLSENRRRREFFHFVVVQWRNCAGLEAAIRDVEISRKPCGTWLSAGERNNPWRIRMSLLMSIWV